MAKPMLSTRTTFRNLLSLGKLTFCSNRTTYPTIKRILSDVTSSESSLGQRTRSLSSMTDIHHGKAVEVPDFVPGPASSSNTATDTVMHWTVLPFMLRGTGVVQGGVLVDRIVEVATIAINRHFGGKIYSKQESNVKNRSTSCTLTSIDELKFLKPLLMSDLTRTTAGTVTTNRHLATVEVSVEKVFPLNSGVFQPNNIARLSFESVPSKSNNNLDSIPSETDKSSRGSMFLYQPHMSSYHSSLVMEEYGLILASRLTRHDVVTVHMSDVRLLQTPEPGSAMSVSGEVVSVDSNVLTIFLTVDAVGHILKERQGFRAAEATISYAPINTKKEMVSIDELKIPMGTHKVSLGSVQKLNRNAVGEYVTVLKNRSSRRSS